MAAKIKSIKKTEVHAAEVKNADAGEMTTTVVSWGYGEGYQFPPGLFGVKALSYGTMGCVILKDDGTLTAWDDFWGPGGRTPFHKHLETLKNVVRVKAAYTATDDEHKKTGVYVWKADGSCEFHCVDYDRGHEIQVVDLGSGIVDVLLSRNWTDSDVAIFVDGTLKAVFIKKKGVKEIDESVQSFLKKVDALNDKIRSNPKMKPCDYKTGHLSNNQLSDGLSLLWADQQGVLQMVSVGEICTEEPNGIKEVGCIAGGGSVVLQNGQLKKLDTYFNTLDALPDYGGYSSIQEPIVDLKDIGPDSSKAIGISAGGRAFLVTSSSSIKKDYRFRYSKKNISPPEWTITDAIYSEGTFIGIRRVPVSEQKAFLNSNSKPAGAAGQLVVVGQENPHSPMRITQVPPDLGPVLDAQIFNCRATGWICVKQNGAIFGMYPSDEALDLAPPWFPQDICRIDLGGGFVATRTDGSTLKWGPQYLSKGVPTTPEQLLKHPHLTLPEAAQNAIKVVAYEGELALAIVEEVSAFQRFLAQYPGPGGKAKDQLFYSITRGQALLEQAGGWWVTGPGECCSGPPHAGKEGPAAATRGLQWRLCMAWAGFETWMGGLLATENSKLEAGALAKWSKGLPKLDAIEAPKAGKAIARWIDEEGGEAVLDFLGVNRTDRDTLKTWLLKGQTIADWASMALLAKALRNATVHGALSASTAKELGLQAALEKMPSLLQDFAFGALQQYMQDERTAKRPAASMKNSAKSMKGSSK